MSKIDTISLDSATGVVANATNETSQPRSTPTAEILLELFEQDLDKIAGGAVGPCNLPSRSRNTESRSTS